MIILTEEEIREKIERLKDVIANGNAYLEGKDPGGDEKELALTLIYYLGLKNGMKLVLGELEGGIPSELEI